jgi:CheY-like chemotaxis protein
MMRILIVEDGADFREFVVEAVAKAFPGAQLDEASSLHEAIGKATAARENQPYDVAVLDFLLPVEQGGDGNSVNPDERRKLLKLLGPDTETFNYTANPKSPEVVGFLLDKNLGDTDLPRPVVINLRDEDWGEKLVSLVRSAVHSKRIRAEFRRLFGTRRDAARRAAARPLEAAAPAASLRGDLLAVPDLTQDLNLLARDI